ncbi:pentatricopeptide repeat-containing protein 2, mitochondrial-like isoform X1 [Chelonus insularis]|uniref:pentatricopeptide repeat-containing protein 2, mitochondrial-like isoform X1 n=1 Tax=Chelonus insularis TaxID=460826 RepID=UPI001589C3B7|nr:pentatricopeptide repeat-containing protein 2, mitochondrial-like isoform X1 [Chelonus insularis]
MSNRIKMFTRLGLSVLNNNIKKPIISSGTKTLYTASGLGIDEYKITRERVLVKYGSGADGFRKKMSDIVNNENSMVFSEDLKNFGYMINNTPEELAVLSNLILKYNSQNSDFRFGVIRSGPIIMRALHYLNQPDVAFELFMNPNTDAFFNQITTFILLEDLLYENKKYNQVREVYNKIKLLLNNSVHPKLVAIIIMLSCYKENTPESFEYGLNIYREIINKGNTPLKKIVSAIGALSLNQKAPHITLEILSQFSNQNYISVKSLRLIALAELGRLENIFVEFKFILQHEAKNNQLYKDVIPKIQETFKNGNLEPNPELLQLLEKLQFGGYISDLTLDEHLTMPIELQPKDKKKSRLLKSQLADYDDESDNWGPKSYIKHNN